MTSSPIEHKQNFPQGTYIWLPQEEENVHGYEIEKITSALEKN